LQYGSATGNDLIGDVIGFDLVRIAGLADAQLGLNPARLQKTEHCLIAEGLRLI
jgi:hypothetical protein